MASVVCLVTDGTQHLMKQTANPEIFTLRKHLFCIVICSMTKNNNTKNDHSFSLLSSHLFTYMNNYYTATSLFTPNLIFILSDGNKCTKVQKISVTTSSQWNITLYLEGRAKGVGLFSLFMETLVSLLQQLFIWKRMCIESWVWELLFINTHS